MTLCPGLRQLELVKSTLCPQYRSTVANNEIRYIYGVLVLIVHSSKVGEMKSPIRYEENNFFITKYFLLFS